LQIDGGATVGALVAANPIGSVTTPGDRYFYAAPFEIGEEFGGLGPDTRSGMGLMLESRKRVAFQPANNTVIAIVATDARLTKSQCHRVATAAHDGIARACVPSHTPADGDIVFAVSHGDRQADPMLIGHAAALCLTRAIARAIFEATPLGDDKIPAWKSLNQ
ncbi:MAG: P1 family peptidase, partial [Pseudomonadota bacterium]